MMNIVRAKYSGVQQRNRDNPGRVRFSDVELEKGDAESTRDRRIPPQKTQSFKGDKKKSWLNRQFSGQMNQEYNFSDSAEYPAAVAAAAYAIKTIEDLGIEAQKRENAASKTLKKIRSKSEDKFPNVTEPRADPRKVSDEVQEKRVPITTSTDINIPKEVTAPVPSFKRIPTSADEQFNSIDAVEFKTTEPKRTDVSAPRIKKTPTFPEKNLNSTGIGKPESTFPKSDHQNTKPATFPPTDTKGQSSAKPGMENTKADAWEKAEMAKITERYEKLNAKIFEWESKKKTAAKRKMDKIESDLEKKRAKAMQKYRSKMAMINQIAGGARAKADENRRHEEVQVKEKANKIRTTGKYPASCFCF
ncbi:uncharacterized protein LOC108208204 isoform X2 [Daucus carota subsp. sativus]|uniref:uncharacterized protein LOC108208204 isoform X2 n=1 Tax=Daucus carota subsp. sativus TaxID=79200 RepID=UPI0007EF4D24|nr:PREDICTED: uncharacterized protein LOC108208204 isoform X2 [Daucus carota subsp. sativus]